MKIMSDQANVLHVLYSVDISCVALTASYYVMLGYFHQVFCSFSLNVRKHLWNIELAASSLSNFMICWIPTMMHCITEMSQYLSL